MDALTRLRKLALDVTAAPRYRDYVRRFKGPGSPMPKDEWEKKVLHKGQPPKKDEKPEAESKGEKPKGKHPIPKSMYEYIGGKAPAIQKAIDSGKPINKSDADAVVTLLEKALNSPTTTIDPTVKKHYKSLVKFLKSEASGSAKDTGDSKPKGEEKGDKGDSKSKSDTKTKAKSYSKKYAPAVTQVMDKHSLTDKDADEVRAFKNQKPWQGQKISDAEKLRRFLAKAKPETKERMKGISPADFVKMLGAILDDEGEGGGKMASLDPMARLRALHTACGCGGDDHMADEDMMAGRKWDGDKSSPDRAPYYPGKRKEIGEKPLAGQPGSAQRKQYNQWWRDNFWNAKAADSLEALADLDDDTVDGLISEILFDGEVAGRKWNGQKGKGYDRKPYYPGKRKEIGEKPLAGEPGSAQRKEYNDWWRENFWNEKSAIEEPMARLAAMAVESSQVGKIILDQMGGPRRLMMMLGVKQFITMPNGVQFKFPNKQRSKGNMVKVTLRGDDTYDMEFLNVSGMNAKTVQKHKGVYAEDLVNLFEKQTGWYLRMARDTSEAVLTAALGVEADWQTGMKDNTPVTGPGARPGEGSDVPDGEGNVEKRAGDQSLLNPVYDMAKAIARLPGVASAQVDDWAVLSRKPFAAEVHVTVAVDPKVGGKMTRPLKAWVRANQSKFFGIESAEVWEPRRNHPSRFKTPKYPSGNMEYPLYSIEVLFNNSGWEPHQYEDVLHGRLKWEEPARERLFARTRTTHTAAGMDLYVAVSGGKLLGATDSKSGSSKGYWSKVPRASKAGSFDIVKLSSVPESLAEKLVDFGAANPKTSAWKSEAEAYKAVSKYLPNGKQAHLPVNDPYDFSSPDKNEVKDPPQAKAAASGNYGFPKKLAQDCDAAARRVGKAATTIAKAAYGKDARVAEFLKAHAERGNSLSAKVLLAALAEMGPKVASAGSAERLQQLREANQKTAGGSGAANAKYLSSIPAPKKVKILKAVARHYGISDTAAYDELIDRDAEAVYEYIGNDRGLAMEVLRDFKSMRLASMDVEAKYGLYGYREKTSKLGLSACSDLRHEAGVIASDLHRRRHDKHARISEYLTAHCKEAGCNHTQMLLDSYPSADMKFASLPAPSTIDEWIAWED